MDYEKSQGFSGNPDKAFECAKSVFMGLSFRVTPIGRSELQVENTISLMNNKQNPLLFISQATITIMGSTIAIQAEFGAIRRFVKMLAILFVVLSVPGVAAAVIALSMAGQPAILGVAIGASIVLPLPIILPIISITMRKGAAKALDALMHNMNASAR